MQISFQTFGFCSDYPVYPDHYYFLPGEDGARRPVQL